MTEIPKKKYLNTLAEIADGLRRDCGPKAAPYADAVLEMAQLIKTDHRNALLRISGTAYADGEALDGDRFGVLQSGIRNGAQDSIYLGGTT